MMNAATSCWFTYPLPNSDARLRLFCFPYAGGQSLIYRTWAKSLQKTTEVCLAELPGRAMRLHEPPFTRLPPLVKALGQAIIPHLDKPFAFFGHSMGALIAFELTRYLRSEGRQGPVHLFVSGRGGPGIATTERARYDLPEPEFIEEIKRLKGTPKEVLEHEELMELMVPLLRADFGICQTYQYVSEPPLDCPISAYGGLQDENVTKEHLESWQEQTGDHFDLHVLPGDHFFIHSAEPLLLRLLNAALSKSTSKLRGVDSHDYFGAAQGPTSSVNT
jgi:medium-chain acyl-[acyl-carrier-protein] hydrolase